MEKLGRYQLIEIVGEGAMARVYKAFDPEINRTLAVKVLKSQLASDEQYRLRFLREAKGAGILSHPNIVTIYDVGLEGGHPYIAEELVEGATLTDLLRSGRKLTIPEIVDIGIQLARALGYAHSKGIVHRDVKPGNIMLVANSTTVKVADFGICRIEEAAGTNDFTQYTAMGDVLGTPNYMSPEQVLGEKVDARSDLFSAGVVLYKLVTGVLPFEGDTLISVAMKIAQTEPPAVDKLQKDVPASLRRVIERALKKSPDKRFQNGDEMAQALIAVAREINEAEARKRSGNRIPLGVRWAAIMAALVAVTMSITGTVLYNKQYHAMMDQVMGYGESLAKFMASQSAVPLLSEDWAAIDVFVQETMSRQAFPYLVVVDYDGTIRGSNEPATINTRYVPPSGTPVVTPDQSIVVQALVDAKGAKVLDFAAPILFQNKTIGQVHLGVLEEPLSRVARLILVMLAVLTLVTIAAAALVTYFLARRLTEPLRALKLGLAELAAGRYDFRIEEKRRDEFGELYTAFDQAAAAIEKRQDEPGGTPPKPSGEETLIVASGRATASKALP